MITRQQQEEQITLYAVQLLIERLNRTTTHTYYLIQPNKTTYTFFFTVMCDDVAIFSETNISCVFAFLRGIIYILEQ